MMKEAIRKEEGITLVALVVTVIILMILAGITLTLVLGQNGIIGKAKEAKEVSANADKATDEGLNSLYNEMLTATRDQTVKTMPTTIATAGNNKLSDTENVQLKDDEGNTVTIPAGFHIASGSPTKQEDGIVIEDKDGNQFVWIPVSSISAYNRIDFGKQWSSSYSEYSEAMPSNEQISVSKNHGYYIGRYETGDKEDTINKKTSSIITDTLTIKKGQWPYNYVTRDQAVELAEGMKTQEKYEATTKLCSSYAWDTAINFIQKTVANYGISSPQGNYYDTTFTYTDITGENNIKTSGSSILVPTGQTTPVCNIYDMGGNAVEWTTEFKGYNIGVVQGCGYYNSYNDLPAGSRSYTSENDARYDIGFRVTLYL